MSGYSHGESFDCPHCGNEVPLRAKRCRHCGASDESGWQESGAEFATGDYADDEFDYDDFIAREFGEGGRSATGHSMSVWTRILILAVIIALLLPLALQLLAVFDVGL